MARIECGPLDERGSLAERLHLFVDELRARRLPISMVERIDAMAAVELVDLADRHTLHTFLGATLVKNADHQAAFDEVFELFFRTEAPAGRPRETADESQDSAVRTQEPGGTPPAGGTTRLTAWTPLDLERARDEVLGGGSERLARLVAESAVARYARFEPGRPAGGVLYEKWTLQGLGLGDEVASPGVNADLLRRQIVTVIRELLVADRGAAAVARTLRRPLTADIDVSMASPAEFAEIERTIRPLQRKLATSLIRRRRRRAGVLDVRATLRRSMATGGVPVTLVSRPPRPTRPQLYVLADVSGSVANFATVGICLMAAMREAFSRLRTFAFVQDAVEVTDLLATAGTTATAAGLIRSAVADGSIGSYTDYGRSLQHFHAAVRGEIGHRSSVLILGDARGNNLPARVPELAAVAQRAGSVHWLNPEPRSLWGTGDSLMRVYAPHCTQVISCRTVNDLARFVDDLA